MKPTMLRNTFLMLSLFCATAIASAQDVQLYVGSAAPAYSFKNYASRGLNVGTKLDFHVRPHLSVLASIDLFSNQLSPMVANHATSLYNYTSIATPLCFNIPLMAHAKFTTKMSKKPQMSRNLNFWCEGALGINRRMISQEQYTYTCLTSEGMLRTYDVVNNFDTKVTLAHQWGFGFTFRDRWSMSLVWYHLGRANLTGNVQCTWRDTGTTTTTQFDEGRFKVRLRTLRIGYSF